MTDSYYELQHGYYFEDISVGMEAVVAKTITEADILLFAGVSGDTNPIHLNHEFAEQSRFKQRIAHGMLTTSLWSTALGTKLPGPGCIYMSQDTNFLRPVFIGDTVTAKLTIIEVIEDKQRVVISTEAFVNGKLVATGQAKAWVPRREAN